MYGKFDKAMLKLIVRVLTNERKAQEVLASALTKIQDKKSALVAAKGIERGEVVGIHKLNCCSRQTHG